MRVRYNIYSKVEPLVESTYTVKKQEPTISTATVDHISTVTIMNP